MKNKLEFFFETKHIVLKLIMVLLLFVLVCCVGNDFFSVPNSIEQAKEYKVFIKKYVPTKENYIVFNNKKYYFKEVFLCGRFNGKEILKDETSIVFVFDIKDWDMKNNFINQYNLFEVEINDKKYDLGVDSSQLALSFSFNEINPEFKSFTFVYNSKNKKQKVIFNEYNE
jgi:hypothetical protein